MSGPLTATAFVFLSLLSARASADDRKECLECHPDAVERLGGEFNHPPFEEKDCYACHLFHGFQNKLALNGTVFEVCTTCHETVWELDEETTHYPILDEASCLTCHTPHGADNKDLLISRVEDGLCTECH